MAFGVYFRDLSVLRWVYERQIGLRRRLVEMKAKGRSQIHIRHVLRIFEMEVNTCCTFEEADSVKYLRAAEQNQDAERFVQDGS